MSTTTITVTLAEAEEDALTLQDALEALAPAERQHYAHQTAVAYFQAADEEESERLHMTASIAAFLARTTATATIDEAGVQVQFLQGTSSDADVDEEGQS